MPRIWLEWSREAFDRAKAENKPVLLSLVTAWSAGCAAMDETTYAHPGVASLIDARFVPVRVDADRRPDINDRYNLGGWPTTAFLTSSGEVLSGGTYLSGDQMLVMLPQVADAYRTRALELEERAARLQADRVAAAGRYARPDAVERADAPLDRSAIDHGRSVLVEHFDRRHGGFASSPKVAHPSALMLALSLVRDADDEDLGESLDLTFDRIVALADPVAGGFYRSTDGEDWSGVSGEKTLEDNAALLHVFVEGAINGRTACRDHAAQIVRWVRSCMSHPVEGGFYNAQTPAITDKTMYVDRNAMMVGALIRTAALFDDIWLRDFALNALETVIVPTYKPGDGVGHTASGDGAPVRGLLTDQIHVASALIWAHAATGQLPYSMLAAELVQFAIRQMWNDAGGNFRDRVDRYDPVMPFELNCHAACVLDRLAILTGEQAYHDRAREILRSLAGDYRERGLFGAPYALALREVMDRQPPAGLELAPVDWGLA